MKNTFGNQVTITLFGESRGEAVGCIIDGLTPGLTVDDEIIKQRLMLRQPQDDLNTGRKEADEFSIISGVYNGKTTGTPVCILIKNSDLQAADKDTDLQAADKDTEDIAKNSFPVRPSHADYTGYEKYHGFNDPRGGGHFSGRMTAPIAAMSGIIIPALEKKGIFIGSHIKSIGNVEDRSFENILSDINIVKEMKRPVFSGDILSKMEEEVRKAKSEGDSVGGVIETAVYGMPAGIGEPWFDTVEGVLSKALFSIPAIKGVEFGDGFALSKMRGSIANDSSFICENRDVEDKCHTDAAAFKNNKCIGFLSNHGGGVDGGITNGAPVIFRCAVKPTPTIAKEQSTIDIKTKENITISGKGRNDPCIALRIPSVIESITAFTIYDLLAGRYGIDWFYS